MRGEALFPCIRIHLCWYSNFSVERRNCGAFGAFFQQTWSCFVFFCGSARWARLLIFGFGKFHVSLLVVHGVSTLSCVAMNLDDSWEWRLEWVFEAAEMVTLVSERSVCEIVSCAGIGFCWFIPLLRMFVIGFHWTDALLWSIPCFLVVFYSRHLWFCILLSQPRSGGFQSYGIGATVVDIIRLCFYDFVNHLFIVIMFTGFLT